MFFLFFCFDEKLSFFITQEKLNSSFFIKTGGLAWLSLLSLSLFMAIYNAFFIYQAAAPAAAAAAALASASAAAASAAAA